MDENDESYKNVEPILDAKDKLKDISFGPDCSVVQYRDSLYKIDFGEVGPEVKMIDIDLTEFGLQTVTSNGEKALVTPSTPNAIVHEGYAGPATYYSYNETTGKYDIPFTGYCAYDLGGYERYYDSSGVLVMEEKRPST